MLTQHAAVTGDAHMCNGEVVHPSISHNCHGPCHSQHACHLFVAQLKHTPTSLHHLCGPMYFRAVDRRLLVRGCPHEIGLRTPTALRTRVNSHNIQTDTTYAVSTYLKHLQKSLMHQHKLRQASRLAHKVGHHECHSIQEGCGVSVSVSVRVRTW